MLVNMTLKQLICYSKILFLELKTTSSYNVFYGNLDFRVLCLNCCLISCVKVWGKGHLNNVIKLARSRSIIFQIAFL